ncbi:hypothetical protein V6N00_09615 [Tersicoccus sp. MR15.9]|uniref:hypothetical protein n=1 Tax=Tersicoccus mangrovi TaxID=3121635 RepID=UPI002FE57314
MTTWDDILAAVTASFAGRGDEPRRHLEACWDATTPDQAAQRCVVAHYLADQQDDVAEEAAWDERALAAHGSVGDEDLAPIGVPSASAFLPSLHLNLGDDYLRLGRRDDAARHLTLAQESADLLSDAGYGAMIRAGIEGLQARLTELGEGTGPDEAGEPPPVQ